MIGHIEHGSDFGGLFRYLLAEDKGARIIGGNAAGRTPSELTQEFNNCADQRRTTKCSGLQKLKPRLAKTDIFGSD